MPTYEYLCPECDTRHDIVQSMADPTLTTCPSCGKESLRKQFTGVGVMFKGSGFYRNDSRSSNSSTVPANSGSSNNGSEKSGASKSSSSETSSSSPSSGSGSSSSSGSSAPAAKPATTGSSSS